MRNRTTYQMGPHRWHSETFSSRDEWLKTHPRARLRHHLLTFAWMFGLSAFVGAFCVHLLNLRYFIRDTGQYDPLPYAAAIFGTYGVLAYIQFLIDTRKREGPRKLRKKYVDS